MKKKNIIGKIKFIVLLLIALTQLFPLYWLITFSLKSNTEIFGENVIGLPKVWRWDNYITALSSSNLIRYFLNSVFYSVVTVVVAGIISSMAAYAIAQNDMETKECCLWIIYDRNNDTCSGSITSIIPDSSQTWVKGRLSWTNDSIYSRSSANEYYDISWFL